jgi:hypothetical protein
MVLASRANLHRIDRPGIIIGHQFAVRNCGKRRGAGTDNSRTMPIVWQISLTCRNRLRVEIQNRPTRRVV